MSNDSRVYLLYRSFWKGLDLLFPPVCGGCGKSGSRWCEDCQRGVHFLSGSVCDACGIPVESAGLCLDCQRARPRFNVLRSWSVFDAPVRNALHRLKYRNDMGLGDSLAAQMVEFVRGLNWQVDMIAPVPLGRKRLQERGYNQVGLIARPLAMAMQIDFVPDALERARETRSQVGLTRPERRENVQNAFRANRARVEKRRILLMDDVATTGSTLSSCAEAFYAAGVQDVFALTVSRALARHGLGTA